MTVWEKEGGREGGDKRDREEKKVSDSGEKMSEKAQSNRPLTHQIVLVLLVLLLIAESFRFDSHIFFIYLLPWIVLEVEAVIKKANTSEEGRQACACLHHTHTHTHCAALRPMHVHL